MSKKYVKVVMIPPRHHIVLYQINVFFSVPIPTVSVTALNTQTVGQSLTLQCEVTTVRGITSRVDIVWSSGGSILRRINDLSGCYNHISGTLYCLDDYRHQKMTYH